MLINRIMQKKNRVSYFSYSPSLRKGILREGIWALNSSMEMPMGFQQKIKQTMKVYVSNSYKFNKAPLFEPISCRKVDSEAGQKKIQSNLALYSRRGLIGTSRNVVNLNSKLAPLLPTRRKNKYYVF